MLFFLYLLMRCIAVLLLLMFTSHLASAQTSNSDETNDIDEILDEFFVVDTLAVLQAYDDLKSGFLYASISYDDQAYFSGRDFDIDQYGLTPSLTYLNSMSIYLFAGGSYYSVLDPAWDMFVLGAGRFWSIGKQKKWSISAGYTHSFIDDNSEELNKHRLSSSVSLKEQPFQLSIAGGLLFGADPSYYLSASASFDVSIAQINTIELSFEPSFYMLFSQQSIVEQLSFFRSAESTVFDRINSQLELPLVFDNDSIDFAFSYTLNFPNNIFVDEDLSSSGFFSLSLGWLIPL